MATESSRKIVVPATLAEFAHLERWVAALTADYLLPPALAYRIDLCVTELVTNVITYAYPDREPGTITIQSWQLPDRVVIRIEDDGAPFDLTSYVPPDLPSSLADAPLGGRGIRLVRRFTDEIRYCRNAGENQSTLVFRQPGAGKDASRADSFDVSLRSKQNGYSSALQGVMSP